MGTWKEIIRNKKYNEWTVLSEPYLLDKAYYVDARCSCGTEKVVKKNNILTNRSKSCGCITHKKLANKTKNKKAWNAKDAKHLAISQLINSYKFSAKDRNLTYNLTRKQFTELVSKKCTYCGDPHSNTKKTHRGNFKYNGIDRWDNSLGYEHNNCVTCCKNCNKMKGEFGGHEFIEHLIKIRNNSSFSKKIKTVKLKYYYDRAVAAAQNSPDVHTKVGAILINQESGAVIAEGYNGYIRGANDDQIPKTRPEKYDYTIHAETNLICNAVRHGISTNNCIMFVTLSPCVHCIRMMWQAGINKVYFKEAYRDLHESLSMLDLEGMIELNGDYQLLTIQPRS